MKLSFCHRWGAIAALSTLFVLLALAGSRSANAATFTVNSPTDANDGTTGCATGTGRCTLRNAIDASNVVGTSGPVNTINFDAKVFATHKLLPIIPAGLPPIVSNLVINGPTAPGAGIIITTKGSSIENGLIVQDGRVGISSITFALLGNALKLLGGHTLVQNCTFAGDFNGVLVASKRPGTLTAKNCTFFGNAIGIQADNSEDSPNPYNTTTLESCTVAGNELGIANSDVINLSNSIVAANNFFDIADETLVNDGGHNLVDVDAENVGFDPSGLNDNGGPTPTVGLLSQGEAIDAGATSLPTDGRGFARDSKPDIGAFEFINRAPTVDAVAPQNATDKVGQKRTFALTISDANSIFDINTVILKINDRLDSSAGVTLSYDVQQQLLSLNVNGHPSAPIRIGPNATAKDVLDNGAIHIVGSEVTDEAPFPGHTITLSIPATIKTGLLGQNTLFVRVEDASGATDPAARAEDFGFVRAGSYRVIPELDNSAPTLSKLSPSVTTTTLSSQGIAPNAQTFGFFAQDVNSADDIQELRFVAGPTLSAAHSAAFVFYPRTRQLLLYSDDGQTLLGGGRIGESGILANSQVQVDLSKVKLQVLGDGKSLGLVLPLQAKSGLLGKNSVWLRAQDTSGVTTPNGDTLGYVKSGTWVVSGPSSSASPSGSVAPSAGGS